ncbi:MAG: LysR family transcriptional regulator [Pseudomonadota bacterium]
MNKIERPPLNSELLRTFVAIAEHQHLTLAAAELNRTQSALSVQLRKIETALDTRLFERLPRGMALTPDGERLLPLAQSILSDLQRVRAMFGPALRGKMRVGIPDHYDDMIFERVLARFGRTHPLVDVVVTSGCTGGFARTIREGRLDVAVVAGPQAEGGEWLETEETHWVEGKGFECPPEAPVPLAVLDRDCGWSKMPIAALTQAGRPFNVTFTSTSFSNLRCAIRAGLAIGVLPARAIEPGMRPAPPSRGLPPLPATIRTLLIAESAPAAIANALAGALKEGLATTPAARATA